MMSHLNYQKSCDIIELNTRMHTHTQGVRQDPLLPYTISGVLDPITQGSTPVCALLQPQDLEQSLAH